MILVFLAGKDFEKRLQTFIDDELPYHSHKSVQLHDNLPILTTDYNSAKNSRKATFTLQNNVEFVHEIKATATKQSKESVWIEWINSESLKLIAIVGQSGAGKSNLAKKFLKSPLITSAFRYRFYISLKDVFDKKVNLLEFLTQQKLNLGWVENPNLKDHSDITNKFYQKMIDKLNNEKVCIIFDDIGIGSFSYDKDEKVHSCFRKHFAKQFFSSILSNELLCKAKVVVVLNHWEYEHVTLQLQPETWKLVHVFGINKQDQLRMAEGTLCLFQTCCAYNKTPKNLDILKVGVCSQFHNTDNCLLCKKQDLCDCADEIQLFLNVPIHCRSFLEHCSRCTKGCRVANASYLLLNWLHHIARIYPTKSYRLIEVGKFAWEKYTQHKFLFAFEELKSLSKVERNIFFISLCYIQSYEKDLLYRFFNILMQDFLAAVWCLSLSDGELEKNKEQFEKWDNSAIVIGFMDEICQMHKNFKFKLKVPVNQENIAKIQNFSLKSINKENFNAPPGLSGFVQALKRKFVPS